MTKGLDDSKIRRAVIFEGISDEAVAELCADARVVSYKADHRLFERGGEGNELMILQEGFVELLFPVQIMGVTREVIIESKQAGDVVAWSSLVSPYRFTLRARCASDCTLTAFSRVALDATFASNAEAGFLFMRNLARVIGLRLDVMQTMWTHDLQASAAKRLG